MAYPVQSARRVTNSASNQTTHTINYRASHTAGARIWCAFMVDGNAQTITFPSPFSSNVLRGTYQVGSQAFAIAYHTASGSEGGTTFNITSAVSADSTAMVWETTGVDTGTAPEISADATGSGTTPNPGNLAQSWGASETLFTAIAGVGSTDGSSTFSGYPSGYTDTEYSNSGAAGGGVMLGIGFKQVSGTSDDPGTFTESTSTNWAAFAIAEKPGITSSLTDVDSDESITTAQTGRTYTGTGLTDADGMLVKTGTRSVAVTSFVATNATSGTFTAPTTAAAIAANVSFKASAVTFDIQDGGVSLGTLGSGTLAQATYTQHAVSDISQASDADCIYNGQSPSVATGDYFLVDALSTLGYAVDMSDTQGFPTITSGTDNRTDTFNYRWYDVSGEEYSSSGVFEMSQTPVLTVPLASMDSATTGTASVLTDQAEGTLYVVITTSATQPSIAQIKAGQNHAGAAATFAANDNTPTATTSFNLTGLSSNVNYYAHFTQANAAATPLNAAVVSSASFSFGIASAIGVTQYRIRHLLSLFRRRRF